MLDNVSPMELFGGLCCLFGTDKVCRNYCKVDLEEIITKNREDMGRFKERISVYPTAATTISLSLSLSHTHTHTHTYIYIYIYILNTYNTLYLPCHRIPFDLLPYTTIRSDI